MEQVIFSESFKDFSYLSLIYFTGLIHSFSFSMFLYPTLILNKSIKLVEKPDY